MRSSSFVPMFSCLMLVPGLLHCGSERGGDDAEGNAELPAFNEPAEMEPAVTDPAPEEEMDDGVVPGTGEEAPPNDIELDNPPEPTSMGGGELTSPVPTAVPAALDCGPDGWAVENAGPPENRVNYVIVADGYGANSIDTTLEEHINRALDRRFNHESGEPYGRYRKFVNICVMKVVSANDGIGNGPTAFDGGNGGDRLARVNRTKVRDYLNANLPEGFEVDWQAVVLNQNLWENTGSDLMLWSGANRDAPGAALHEGGHGFHGLADEYCGSGVGTGCGPNQAGETGRESREVNSTGNPLTTAGKWDVWLGTTQKALKDPDGEATGLQGVFVGSRYVDTAQYRPSGNSMMNSLFGDDPDTSFNSVSREQMIFSIWRAVRPVDSTSPAAGEVENPTSLTVNVVDPNVISIDWEVDGTLLAERAGGTFNIPAAELTSGSHIITARAYDNANDDLVRNRTGECPDSVTTDQYCHAPGWLNSIQTVEWTVNIP